jgi:hypothetical protein
VRKRWNRLQAVILEELSNTKFSELALEAEEKTSGSSRISFDPIS